jgi:urease accessory protein UreE
MVVIDHPHAATKEPLAGKTRDTLRLTWEGRRWARRRVKTTGGREVALLVPDDTAMVQLLDRLGARWDRRLAVYTPMGFGHTHGGAHAHDH